MIVVDANIVAFYLIQGPRTVAAHRLRELDAEWIVPALWCVELQGVLWKYVQRQGMPRGASLELFEEAVSLFGPNEVAPSPGPALEAALNSGISVYDAQYVSLARQLDVPLVTEDVPVQKACPGIAVSLDEFIGRGSGGHVVRESRHAYRARRKRSL